MKVRITINPKRRTVKVQPPEDPARENLEGLAELAILGSGANMREVDDNG